MTTQFTLPAFSIENLTCEVEVSSVSIEDTSPFFHEKLMLNVQVLTYEEYLELLEQIDDYNEATR